MSFMIPQPANNKRYEQITINMLHGTNFKKLNYWDQRWKYITSFMAIPNTTIHYYRTGNCHVFFVEQSKLMQIVQRLVHWDITFCVSGSLNNELFFQFCEQITPDMIPSLMDNEDSDVEYDENGADSENDYEFDEIDEFENRRFPDDAYGYSGFEVNDV